MRYIALDSKYKIGENQLAKMLGDSANQTREMLKGDFSDIERYILEVSFGDIYNRSGLDLRLREVITLSSLISQGASSGQIRLHMISLLNLGFAKEELIELIIQCIPNVGFPKILDAVTIAKEVFDS